MFARLFTGGTLLLAGMGKLPERMQFIDLVAAYHVLPYPIAVVYGTVLPWIEIIVGSLLVVGVFIRLAAILIIPLMTSFIIANSISLYRGKIVCDSCFGGIIIAIPTPVALLLDFLLLGLVTCILRYNCRPWDFRRSHEKVKGVMDDGMKQ